MGSMVSTISSPDSFRAFDFVLFLHRVVGIISLLKGITKGCRASTKAEMLWQKEHFK